MMLLLSLVYDRIFSLNSVFFSEFRERTYDSEKKIQRFRGPSDGTGASDGGSFLPKAI